MKTAFRNLSLSLILLLSFSVISCTKKDNSPSPNGLLKKVITDGYTTGEYNYNDDNLITEVNSTMIYRRFLYDQSNRIIKEELAINPNAISSSRPVNMQNEFVDPDKTGITMYLVYKYSLEGNLSRQLAYVSSDGTFEFRSMRTFEYDSNNKISKILLQQNDSTVNQLITYQYDTRGNVTEENGYSYLFLPAGSEPTHLYKSTFEYDNYLNPFSIFSNTGSPGINSNLNNITKVLTISYLDTPGLPEQSQYIFSYEYDPDLHFPVKSSEGSEYVYDR
jgi:hypothetical protein